ncbi:hypothetical protein QN277_007789 [Acacia crassicarpa]|uniref:Uncharacterized protein n=1 Tax=Acacia crassicarpa TaxID=499986 RepID=A0AAE1IWM5_9FABA|nr:hypothetical protein QN277_007789 [Acacia crassicarpa]
MTTGRINQVAFLRDAAPRPRAAGAVVGRERPSCIIWELLSGLGRESSPTAFAGSESIARPRAPRDRYGLGGARGVLRCPPAPVGGRRMEAYIGRPASPEGVGSTRTGLWGTIPPGETDADRLPTVRWTGTEPAGRDDPNTTHTPTRSCLPDAAEASTPRRPLGSEQMEAREAPVQHR